MKLCYSKEYYYKQALICFHNCLTQKEKAASILLLDDGKETGIEWGIIIKWNDFESAVEYNLRYRVLGLSTWQIPFDTYGKEQEMFYYIRDIEEVSICIEDFLFFYIEDYIKIQEILFD